MMKISKKAEHAVRALLDLALFAPPNRGARSAEIARRTGIPQKFLDAILLELRKAGFVSSKRGPDGGHRLARDPARVTVGALLDAIDGPPPRRSRGERRAASPADLCVQALWDKVGGSVRAVVDHVTLEDLRRQATPGSELDFTI